MEPVVGPERPKRVTRTHLRGCLRLLKHTARKIKNFKSKKHGAYSPAEAARVNAVAAKWMTRFNFVLAVVAFLSAAIAFFTLLALRDQATEMHQSTRPWIAFDIADDGGIGIDSDTNGFTVRDGGKKATIGLHYWLNNTGRYPANVGIYGIIVEDALPAGDGKNCTLTDLDCVRDQAQKICAENARVFAKKPKIWSVVPGAPMEYAVVYDGDLSKENHLAMADLTTTDPNNDQPHDLTNIGCIVYESSENGDNEPHQTPFLAKVKIRWGTPKVSVAKGILVIGHAN